MIDPHQLAEQLLQTATRLATVVTEREGWDGDYAALLIMIGQTTDALRGTAEAISDAAETLGEDLNSRSWKQTATSAFTAANTLYTAASQLAVSATDVATGVLWQQFGESSHRPPPSER
jgi:hypothetical protein